MSAALVQQIKEDLIARGIIPVPQTTNEHAGEITVRVAFATGGKLVTKRPEQNGCVIHGVRISHDVIAYPDAWIDCLAGAGPPANENRPVWNPTGMGTAALIDPWDLDADLHIGPDPIDDVPSDREMLAQTLVELEAIRDQVHRLLTGVYEFDPATNTLRLR